jgi:transposase
VSVVNPLSVKRFIQMKWAKVKTDKSNAKTICEYALINEEITCFLPEFFVVASFYSSI